ncbi:MAG: endonuclease/exonuclease/phosphatase family protein [Chloroflexota bacterium]|nr:endonuclease/exonuclease/phosphatase family protein [Chloroflexota bacterium]
MTGLDLRIATLNISGGEKTFEEFPHDTQKSRKEALKILIKQLDANLLCLQEVSQHVDLDGVNYSMMEEINHAGGYDYSYYGETLSMQTHMQVKKEVMVTGIFSDWWNWSKGNAIHAKFPFARLGDPQRPGAPRNIPLFQPVFYEGTRDTDPRCAILGRLKVPPYPFVINLHLSTLVGERPPKAIPEKIEQSRHMREHQIHRLLDLVRRHILQKNEPLILAGDFNATIDEDCISQRLISESGFQYLTPENEGPTHPALARPIDHIFFYPKERLVDYSCRIEVGSLSRRASDHLPVVADIRIK